MSEEGQVEATSGLRLKARYAGLIGGPLVALLVWAVIDFNPARPEVGITAAVVVLMAAWWVTEAIPLWATALLPVFLFPFFGVMDGKKVSVLYMNHLIFLFLGGFLVALAMERWNLHRRIALRILSIFGGSPKGILAGFMVATGYLSMWISNTASTMLMVPIVMAVLSKLDEACGREKMKRYGIALLLGVAYSASIGGISTLVGSPPNPVFVKIFSISFPKADEVSFAQWMAVGLPVAIVFMLFTWSYLAFFYAPTSDHGLEAETFAEEYRSLGRITYEETVVLAVFLALGVLWVTRQDLTVGPLAIPGWSDLFSNPSYINDGTVAIALALVLFVIPSKREPGRMIAEWEFVQTLPWGIILLFGGGFALASGFKESGLSEWVGEQMVFVKGFPPVVIVFAVCFVTTFLTELTSNTATAQILLPILASLSVALEINPLLLMVPATMAHSFAFMLPVATPPNAIIFGAGRVRIADMAFAGLVLNLVGVVVLTLAAFVLVPLVFGVDPASFPDWAKG